MDPKNCNSPDFPSSQECFSVGWDWSGQVRGSNKPTIRVVERPERKRNESVQLLEHQRTRRLVRNCDPDMFDASSFKDQLKSLASDFKYVPEAKSPMASPPPTSFRRRGDIVITPTSMKCSAKRPLGAQDGASGSKTASSETQTCQKKSCAASENENLSDLLNDSLGADLLKCSQDLERDLQQTKVETPKSQVHEHHLQGPSSSRKKSRLSLSSKKSSSNVRSSACRRINDLYESNAAKSPKRNSAGVSKDKQQNSKSCKPVINSNAIGKAALLNPNTLKEKEMNKPQKTSSSSLNTAKVLEKCSTKTEAHGAYKIFDDDDELVSPVLLKMIENLEKEATQDTITPPPAEQQPRDLMEWIDKQHSKDMAKVMAADKRKQLPSSHKKMGSSSQCTPEEIEKKRQEARKRLQLKKK